MSDERTALYDPANSQHGHDLLLQGFTVSQVVHDYGDICQAITELAVEMDASISTDDFRTLNRCLDDAIAGAVTEYGRERNQSSIDGESARGTERLGFFIHEMRNLISTASYAFEVLKSGNVGVGGSTGQVLQRSLAAQRALISRSLAAFSRWAVEANQGRVYARNLPERGCVFTVDLPRVPVPIIAAVV